MDTRLKTQLAELDKNRAETEKRRANIIMYDVLEVQAADANSRKEEATTHFNEAIKKLGLVIKRHLVNRIGKRNEGKTRQIKIALNKEQVKALLCEGYSSSDHHLTAARKSRQRVYTWRQSEP